jgi:hypothetical protein
MSTGTQMCMGHEQLGMYVPYFWKVLTRFRKMKKEPFCAASNQYLCQCDDHETLCMQLLNFVCKNFHCHELQLKLHEIFFGEQLCIQ